MDLIGIGPNILVVLVKIFMEEGDWDTIQSIMRTSGYWASIIQRQYFNNITEFPPAAERKMTDDILVKTVKLDPTYDPISPEYYGEYIRGLRYVRVNGDLPYMRMSKEDIMSEILSRPAYVRELVPNVADVPTARIVKKARFPRLATLTIKGDISEETIQICSSIVNLDVANKWAASDVEDFIYYKDTDIARPFTDLRLHAIYDEDFPHISELTTLRNLDVGYTTELGFELLSDLPASNLEILKLSNVPLYNSRVDMFNMSQFVKLKRLTANYEFPVKRVPKTVTHLSLTQGIYNWQANPLPRLTALRIIGNDYDDDDDWTISSCFPTTAQFMTMPNLTQLSIQFTRPEFHASIDFLVLSKLEFLSLRGNVTGLTNFALRQMTNLRYLSLDGDESHAFDEITDDGLDGLANLEVIVIDDVPGITGKTISRVAKTDMSDMPEIIDLPLGKFE